MFSRVLGVSMFCAFAQAKDVLPNSCNDLEDGTYWMKLIDSDEYPVVSIKCSNGYGILDYSHDNKLSEYFDTFMQWFPHTAGPTNDIHVNWREWFLPHTIDPDEDESAEPMLEEQQDGDSDADAADISGGGSGLRTKYVLAPDCNVCDEDHQRQLYPRDTTYWMTGTIFGCFWSVKGAHNCDYDYDTTSCYTCTDESGKTFSEVTDDSNTAEYDKTGICPHNIRKSDYYTPTLHDHCSAEESQIMVVNSQVQHLKPSIGTEGSYCVCFQQQQTQYFEIDEDEKRTETITDDSNVREKGVYYKYNTENEDERIGTDEDSNNIYELYQKDFESGTYRIKKPGTYKIMEDITFDFAANLEDPNGAFSYLPNEDQVDEYPGAGGYYDVYFLGFFAGITIEADNVVLDLNDKTLQMSEYFYHQQRWFTTVELATQYFLPGQGIGNFGPNPIVASNVIIKDGILGLTSHHGIHGNYNKNIEILNVKVQYFETHGIQFNGFDNIKLENVEVGPTSSIVKFSGEYAHMRQLLPRYYKISDEIEESYNNGEIDENDMYIHFYGRDKRTTMREMTEELEKQMNLAWDYVINGKTIDKSDKENYDSYVSALNLFVNDNENSVPYGAAQYGIFLNTFGASIFTYNLATNFYSTTAILNNVKIYGMRHELKEYGLLQYSESGNMAINPFNAPLNIYEMIDGLSDINTLSEANDILLNPKYRGNVFLDAEIASEKFSNSFSYLGLQIVMTDWVLPWATGDDLTSVYSTTDTDGNDKAAIMCDVDAMIHTGKGINGLRLDGISDIYIKDVEVYDLKDTTPVGKNICGAYQTMFRQTAPMQVGFSGNMNQGININAAKEVVIDGAHVHNIESETGQAYGISIWPSCEVTLKGDIKVEDLRAGTQIESGTYTYDDLPNKAPEVCGVRVYYEYGDYTTDLDDSEANFIFDDASLVGHAGCFGTDTKSYVTYDAFESNQQSGNKQQQKMGSAPSSPVVKSMNSGMDANVESIVNQEAVRFEVPEIDDNEQEEDKTVSLNANNVASPSTVESSSSMNVSIIIGVVAVSLFVGIIIGALIYGIKNGVWSDYKFVSKAQKYSYSRVDSQNYGTN